MTFKFVELGSKLLRLGVNFKQATQSLKFAKTQNSIGFEFGYFGRKIGRKLLLHNPKQALHLYLNPVSIVRYFEFPFVFQAMNVEGKKEWECLDVSSPYLYSLYVAPHVASITMINPDQQDILATRQTIDTLDIPNIDPQYKAVHELADRQFDCIYAISVIEHIAGDYSDIEAIQYLYTMLKPNGRLILTFPVDRQFENEYRETDYYGTQEDHRVNERYFFQRIYDLESIQTRLLNPISAEHVQWAWFGEKEKGIFDRYIQDWKQNGYNCTVNDPEYIATQYQIFDSWQDMPGKGVCGLVITK